ncbi:MAG: outer membrane lipoprotein-sorting protein [Limisphaerales bacterium]
MILFYAFGAMAEKTNALSDAEIQGHSLAQEILSRRPAENSTNTGILHIRDGSGSRSEIPIICRIVVSISNANTYLIIPDWQTFYQANLTNQTEYLRVIHATDLTNIYSYSTNRSDAVPVLGDIPLSRHLFPGHLVCGSALMSRFAGSDFWLCDLGLEFFHWPAQKILPKTTNLKRGREYTLLESTNPNPYTNGYSRVVTWIDKETGGILQAEAYDKNGEPLKEFSPKSFKKVNGQWQLQEMEIRNVQTGSRTRLEFDLKK